MHRILEGIAQNRRIASAYLFVGPPGSGKSDAAYAFADLLGVAKIDQIKVEPEGASIKIEQIRELQRLTRYGPTASDYLFAVIDPADVLTPEAGAAFLKTLEEPPPGVVFFLLAAREDQIPATITSRCQKIIFEEEAKVWQPKPEWNSFYAELKNLKGLNHALGLSARLEKEKERIEELLYDLVFFVKQELGNVRMARILLEAVKNLRKKANLKLTLDVACVKLAEV